MRLHCGGLREPHPCPASHSGWCKQHWFPSCQTPVSLEIIAKQQFFHRDLSWAPGVLTFRVGLKRPSVCPLRCSHLLSSASPGAQEPARYWESGGPVPSERLTGYECQLRGALDSSWISGSVASRFLLGSSTARGETSPTFHVQETAHTHTYTPLLIKISAAVSQSEQECKLMSIFIF